MQETDIDALAFNPAGHCLNCKYRGCFGSLLLFMAVVLALVSSLGEHLSQALRFVRVVIVRNHQNGDYQMG
jgi:hypothetical protein